MEQEEQWERLAWSRQDDHIAEHRQGPWWRMHGAIALATYHGISLEEEQVAERECTHRVPRRRQLIRIILPVRDIRIALRCGRTTKRHGHQLRLLLLLSKFVGIWRSGIISN
jgi:hypothetical protein